MPTIQEELRRAVNDLEDDAADEIDRLVADHPSIPDNRDQLIPAEYFAIPIGKRYQRVHYAWLQHNLCLIK